MKKIRYLLVFPLLVICYLAPAQDHIHKNIMLILGSANLPSLQHRIDIGFQLFKSKTFDRIIVSGGCGAHNSTLCEASEMKRLLVENGVPAEIIFKEERSKTTVQNYVYSRILEDGNGEKIIQPEDTVYVVSDHWHAISVAARLNRYDHVTAFYHIEGNLQPKETDKVDYASILYSYADNEKFARNALWPTVDAVFRKSDGIYLLIDDLVFSKTQDNLEKVQPLKELFPLGAQAAALTKIDAALNLDKGNTIILVRKDTAFHFAMKRGYVSGVTKMPLREWIKMLPASWSRIDALFMMKNSLFIFHDDELAIASKKGAVYTAMVPVKIKQRISNFPFNWAGGYIDAADFDPITKTVTLFKAKEQLKLDQNLKVIGEKANPFTLSWPTAYYGERKEKEGN